MGGALALVLAVRPSAGQSMALVAPGTTLLLGLIQVSGFTILQTSALVEGGPGKTLGADLHDADLDPVDVVAAAR